MAEYWCDCGMVAGWYLRRIGVEKNNVFYGGVTVRATCDHHLMRDIRQLSDNGQYTVTVREERQEELRALYARHETEKKK